MADTSHVTAAEILSSAIQNQAERAKLRDAEESGERSMGRAVTAFNALTGHSITETEGWQFMVVLKMARAGQGEYHADDYLDQTSYSSLAGEAAARERLT